ncbi:DNA mobilization endonuclease VirD1/MobC family subunit [uncultured Jannaschia sp.]|uniref:DNA mobilization endonuclease VirD1/MobC family subunit n=1 Tax=uncultured Jannaschia sp. TaxID=293347 RepID=UPI0026205458|nr:DNA mobilization endonuclease VirD1/MobC family subunit [uncultured Jannaschia sp.]
MPADDPAPPDWTARRMRGGTWVEAADADAPPGRVDRVVTVKMSAAELAELDAAIAPLGLKRNRALRIAARRIGGFVEAAPEEVALLRDAVRQLGGIARNVNQIARAANRTRDPDYRGFLEERAALGREMARVEARMQAVLDLAARRRDGLARLEAAAGVGDGSDAVGAPFRTSPRTKARP